MVRREVIMYSLYLAKEESVSVWQNGSPFSIERIYSLLFATFQRLVSPLYECAEGPIPKYFFFNQ